MMLQGLSLFVCQCMLAAHPFPQRDVCLSEVLGSYNTAPLSVPQQMSQLDLAFRLTPGVETFPNYMNRPLVHHKIIQKFNIAIFCVYVHIKWNMEGQYGRSICIIDEQIHF